MRIRWFFESQLWIVIVYWRFKLVFLILQFDCYSTKNHICLVLFLFFVNCVLHFSPEVLNSMDLVVSMHFLLFKILIFTACFWYPNGQQKLVFVEKLAIWAAETCFCWKVSFNPFKATIFVNFVLLLTQMGSSINAAAVLKCKIKNKCCFLTCTFTILCKMFHNMYLV